MTLIIIRKTYLKHPLNLFNVKSHFLAYIWGTYAPFMDFNVQKRWHGGSSGIYVV